MTDAVPPEHHQEAIRQIQSDRGWIVNSFAQVEFLIADLIVRCREFGEYDELTATMPYRLDKRVDRLIALLNVNGPLSAYRADLEQVVRNFRAAEERRQFLVHGFCIFLHTKRDETAVRFDRFMPTRDDDAARQTMYFRPETLHAVRNEVVAETGFAMDVFRTIHIRFGWGEA